MRNARRKPQRLLIGPPDRMVFLGFRQAILARKRCVLDALLTDAKRLQNGLGATDTDKGTDFGKITGGQARKVQEKLYDQKCLG